MTTTVPARIEDVRRDRAQRRILQVLVAAQILSGAGLAAGVTVGALLAQDMLGSASLAGLPGALATVGSMLAAVAVGRVSQARGRRIGLAAGYLTGAVGSAGVIAAAVAGSPVLLFLALFVYGAGMATNLQARYAGADLAAPGRRARAVSTVLVATTLGGVAGPNLAAPTGDLAHSLGIPHLAGLFLLAGAAYALAALVLAVWLRPDPLLLARTLEAEPGTYAEPADTGLADTDPGDAQHDDAQHGDAQHDDAQHDDAQHDEAEHGEAPRGAPERVNAQRAAQQRADAQPGDPERAGPRPPDAGGRRPGHPGGAGQRGHPGGAGRRANVLIGVLVMALTQLVMVAIMTMTPVHMHDHGHGTGASGLVIAIHIGAMYLPSPLTGWLVDRYGRRTIAAAAGLALLAAGTVAARAPGDSVAVLAVALALLGLGWNFGLVTGTAIVTDAVPLATRAKTQGLVDVAIALAGAMGGMASGFVVAAAGYPLLAIAGGILALAIVPAVVATRERITP
ncbi:MFS transporter [Actinomycetes bacterium KLBMP 9797]